MKRKRFWRDSALACAGLGLAVLPAGMVPEDFAVLDRKAGLPALSEAEIALMVAAPQASPAERLARHIVRSLEQKA